MLQVARRLLHRQAVVLHLSTLQVLDGMTVTLEERTRAELLNNEAQVAHAYYPDQMNGSNRTYTADTITLCMCIGFCSSLGGEMTLPSLVPLVTRPAPLRGMGIHTLIPDHQEDTHDTSRCTYTYSTDTNQMCMLNTNAHRVHVFM